MDENFYYADSSAILKGWRREGIKRKGKINQDPEYLKQPISSWNLFWA